MIRVYYVFAGMTVAVRTISASNTTLDYFLTDHLGSIVAVTDANGNMLSEQRYLPFGQVRTDVGSITQTDFGYTGQRNLGAQGAGFEIGLMDYKARFYAPYLMRWTQPDQIINSGPQGINRYSYTLNNSINSIDPSGNLSCRDDDEECQKNKRRRLPGKDIPGDPMTSITNNDKDIQDWNVIPEGYSDERWRQERASIVWSWLSSRGGWWGKGVPNIKTLITILLIKEGSCLMNESSFPNRDLGIRAMVGFMKYLFNDTDGITARDLSSFTSFFDPNPGTGWNQKDRDWYQNGPDKYTWDIASEEVENYWDSGAIYDNGRMVNRWWDNLENFGYTEVFYVNIPLETLRIDGQIVMKVLYFGYK